MWIPKLFLPLALIPFLVTFGPAADDSKKNDPQSLPLVEVVEVIGRVPLNRATQSVTVYEKGLGAPGARGLQDLLNRTPGFLVLNGGSFGQMSYTFARGAAVNQSLFIIDGVKVSDPSNSLGMNLTLISTLLLERVEIVRGPLGGLYGSNAMGGVVSLTSRSSEGTSATAGFGSHGTWETAVHAARRSGNWHLSFNAGVSRYKDVLENDGFTGRGLSARALYRRGRLEAGLQLFLHSACGGIPIYMARPTPGREYSQSTLVAALPVTWTAGDHTRVQLRISHNANEYEFRDPGDTWAPYYMNRSRITEAEATLSGRFRARWTYHAGLDTAFQSSMNLTREGAVHENERGGYVSAHAGTDLETGPVLITAGLRVDKYRGIDTAWSPQAGASWLISQHVKLRVSWGKGFRAPTFPERLNPAWGNPALKPEVSRSLEAGTDLLLKNFTLGIAGFDTRYRDLIGFSPLTGRYANLNEAVIRGLEVNAEFRPTGALELRAAWTWLHTDDREYNRRLLRRPQHAVSAGFTWTRSRLSLGADMVYVGKRLDYNELDWISPLVESPAFNTFSFSAAVRVTPTLSVHARVTNAFNAVFSEIYGYPAPGMRFLAGLGFQTE